MKSTWIVLAVLMLLLIVGGYFATASAHVTGIQTTISGAKRFDHFTVTNVSGADISVKVSLYKEGDTTHFHQSNLAVPKNGTAGKVMNLPNTQVFKAECEFNNKTCVIEVQKTSGAYRFTVNSASFVVMTANKMSGEATLVAKDKSTSETIPQID